MAKIRISILLCSILLVIACSLPAFTLTQSATPDVAQTVDAARTESALTVTAGIHSLPMETSGPPTNTAEPTMTPVNTDTPQPSLTPTELSTATVTFTPTATLTATRTSTATKSNNPRLNITGVEKDKYVTVQTENFPPLQVFTIKIGPFSNFSKENKVVGSVESGKGGVITFTAKIPAEYAEESKLAIRLDSPQKYYAYNVFNNQDSGIVQKTATTVPATTCEVKTSPVSYTIFAPGTDFDAVWEVKNTGSEAWESAHVDYKYEKYVEMQKYGKIFDLPSTVDPGDSITLVVDMVAPSGTGIMQTDWVLTDGSLVLCRMSVIITVN